MSLKSSTFILTMLNKYYYIMGVGGILSCSAFCYIVVFYSIADSASTEDKTKTLEEGEEEEEDDFFSLKQDFRPRSRTAPENREWRRKKLRTMNRPPTPPPSLSQSVEDLLFPGQTLTVNGGVSPLNGSRDRLSPLNRSREKLSRRPSEDLPSMMEET